MGFTLFYLGIIILLPLSGLVLKVMSISYADFMQTITSERVVAAFKLSFYASFVAALINGFFGLILSWVLVRYSFPGRKIIDAMVDLPFALPTAVAGIALTAIYSPGGWVGKMFEPWGIKIAFTQMGVIIALSFISLPFVVRTLQPVIMDMDSEIEEAAASLGASRCKTFVKIIFPTIFPALLTGVSLSFAKAVGEYGSVVFISGNMPFKTEIVPLVIMTKLEQYDYQGATAIAVVMLAISFVIMLSTNLLQHWSRVK